MSISAFIPVFNEEKRIKYALTSIQWCDEIIVLDKTSTDLTVEIAKDFGAKVFVVPNTLAYDPDEFDYLFKYCTSEWVLIFTASDIMTVELAYEINKLTNSKDFDNDIIEVPYKRYILGIENKRSPWHGDFHSVVFRKSILQIQKNDVHGALKFKSDRRYTINGFKNAAIYHLTHETVDSMMDRHIRYWRAEGQNYNAPNFKNAFRIVLSAVKHVFITRKTYLLGWNGVVLIFAYLSYSMMSFVYKWENLNKNKASNLYDQLRKESMQKWMTVNDNLQMGIQNNK